MAAEAKRRENKNRLLDPDMTLERLEGDETLLGVVAGAFIRSAPELLEAIDEAITVNDFTRAFEQAHSLKDSVEKFEAPKVLNSVLNIERHARNQDAAAAAAEFPTAAALVRRLLAELAPMVPRHVSFGAQA